MSDDQIAAAIVAKLDGPAEAAAEEPEPAAVQWPKLGQGEGGTAVTSPPDHMLAVLLDQLGIPRPSGLGPRRR
jgi:hypothetical protein